MSTFMFLAIVLFAPCQLIKEHIDATRLNTTPNGGLFGGLGEVFVRPESLGTMPPVGGTRAFWYEYVSF